MTPTLQGHTSYHSHSRWSDGRKSLTEMIRAAEAAGLDEYGVADHFVLTPDRQPIDWSMPLDRLEEYVTEVQAAAAQAASTVRLGIEVDFSLPAERVIRSLDRIIEWRGKPRRPSAGERSGAVQK